MEHNHDHHGLHHDHGAGSTVALQNDQADVPGVTNLSTSSSNMVHKGMMMHFHFGTDETILFSFWDTNSDIWLFLVSTLIIFVISFAYEGLKFYREKLYKDTLRRVSISRESDSSGARIPVMTSDADRDSGESLPVRVYVFTSTHFLQTALHMLQILFSYTLMLVFMTYNVWLCLSVVIGAGLGYLVFGWKRAIIGFDVTEHCQ